MKKPATISPGRQLATFLREYPPAVRKTAETALRTLRAQIPGATEMVYNNFNALVIGFCPGERPSEAIVSIALYPKWVNVFFLDGVALADPDRILKGSGNRVRMIRLDDPAILATPPVKSLIAAAIENADAPFDRAKPRRVLIRANARRRRRAAR